MKNLKARLRTPRNTVACRMVNMLTPHGKFLRFAYVTLSPTNDVLGLEMMPIIYETEVDAAIATEQMLVAVQLATIDVGAQFTRYH